MTDAERQRLELVAREGSHTPMRETDQLFLIGLARRADAAEKLAAAAETHLQRFINDRELDSGEMARRDIALRDVAARMAAAECVALVSSAEYWDQQYPASRIVAAIRARFAIDGRQPTLTEQVAAECADMVETLGECEDETPARIAAAMREAFIRPG